MSETNQTRRRQRLDPGARERILAEIGRLTPLRTPDPDPAELRAALADVRAAAEPAAAEPPAPPAPRARPAAPPPAAAASPPEAAAPAPAPVPPDAHPDPRPDPRSAWALLRTIPVDAARLERNLVITAARTDPAHGAFDVLRTRMIQALAERGWKRVGITSPTKGCGKSFTALNLAVSLSRHDRSRTVLLDMDMRIPALARYLGVQAPGSMGDLLRGEVRAEDHLTRFAPNTLNIGGNVALGLNDRVEPFAAELFQDDATARALTRIEDRFAPDIMLFDMPPALAQDDVIALRPHVDCILMVVGGGTSSAREVREAVRRIGEDNPILGMILNKADGAGVDEYAY